MCMQQSYSITVIKYISKIIEWISKIFCCFWMTGRAAVDEEESGRLAVASFQPRLSWYRALAWRVLECHGFKPNPGQQFSPFWVKQMSWVQLNCLFLPCLHTYLVYWLRAIITLCMFWSMGFILEVNATTKVISALVSWLLLLSTFSCLALYNTVTIPNTCVGVYRCQCYKMNAILNAWEVRQVGWSAILSHHTCFVTVWKPGQLSRAWADGATKLSLKLLLGCQPSLSWSMDLPELEYLRGNEQIQKHTKNYCGSLAVQRKN